MIMLGKFYSHHCDGLLEMLSRPAYLPNCPATFAGSVSRGFQNSKICYRGVLYTWCESVDDMEESKLCLSVSYRELSEDCG